MSSATFFFMYILPLLIGASVWGYILVGDYSENRRRKLPPAE